jgi:hypothetical protein
VENQLTSRAGDTADSEVISDTLNAVKSKISLLVERMIILSDQFKNLEETASLMTPALDDQPPAETITGAGTDQDMDTESPTDEKAVDDFELVTHGGSMFGTEEKSNRVFTDDDEDKSIPGLVKDTDQIFTESSDDDEMFSDLSKVEETETAEPPDDIIKQPAADTEMGEPDAAFEELPAAEPKKRGKVIDLSKQESKIPPSDFAEETEVQEFESLSKDESQAEAETPMSQVKEVLPETPTEPGRVYDLDDPGSESGVTVEPADEVVDHKSVKFRDPAETAAATDPVPAGSPQTGEIDDEEEEVIDLYELGAVDYMA